MHFSYFFSFPLRPPVVFCLRYTSLAKYFQLFGGSAVPADNRARTFFYSRQNVAEGMDVISKPSAEDGMIARHREIEFDEQALHVFDKHISELIRAEFFHRFFAVTILF